MRFVGVAAVVVVSAALPGCRTDAGLSKELVGVWSWNPRDALPALEIKNVGSPTPNLEAVQLFANGQYVHVQKIPGYNTDVAGKPFHVGERWHEWKGTWSVAKGELALVSGPAADRWGARHEPHGWVRDPIIMAGGDDRTFKVVDLAKDKLRLETLAIGDFHRSLQRASAMPERPTATTASNP